MADVHVLFDGRTHNFDFDELFAPERLVGIGINDVDSVSPDTVTPEHIKTALCQALDVGRGMFDSYNVSVYEGKIDVRPEATFG
jgi:hypothetical protein